MNTEVIASPSSIEGPFEICDHELVTMIFCNNSQLLRYRYGDRERVN